MAIVTEEQLRSSYSSISNSLTKTFSRHEMTLNEAKVKAIETIFLSHSHEDKHLIEYAAGILNKNGINSGANLYVDWNDSTMPSRTNGETAQKIKENIRNFGKFVLLASPKAITSNWVNWELGYADAYKYINKLALFPVLKSQDREWKDAEYLQIYPRIEREGNFSTFDTFGSWFVIYPDGQKYSLSHWLKIK